MTPEEKQIIKKTLELAEENNRMLKSIKRQMFWGKVYRIVYWAIILGTAVGLYYYIDPYISEAINAYGGLKGDLRSFGDLIK